MYYLLISCHYGNALIPFVCVLQNDLVEADHQVIVDEEDVPDRRRIELVWRERLPLGMNLLMNDESGLLKVVDFPRGSVSHLCTLGLNRVQPCFNFTIYGGLMQLIRFTRLHVLFVRSAI